MSHTKRFVKRYSWTTILMRAVVMLFLLLTISLSSALAQSQLKETSVEPWWKHAVFYEIYPRSFQDTNGDGIGDLNGITSKLDYLADLGVDALWITPFYPSPQVDFGYDVADYEKVDPQFGTIAEFDRLVAEAHKRHIRIVTDLVLNHTSDQHKYFMASRSSRSNPYRDWYIWRDAKPGGGPPNNWNSGFGPTAWTFDKKTGQYYYHYFYEQQPDLNWSNPAVEKAIFKSIRFWLDRGVDGFRLDAINWLFEDPQQRDNPVLPELRAGSTTEHEQELKFNRDLPQTHDVLQRLRAMTDQYKGGRVLIGEVWVPTMDKLMAYYGPRDNEFQLPFNFFFFTEVKKLDASGFRAVTERTERETKGRWTTYVLSNHDIPRAYDRYGDGRYNDEIAKLLATMLLTLRGSPFFYYGEEIGMVTTDPQTLEDVRDPVGKKYWPGYKGRDGVRTPMQWDASLNAGFTSGTPWLKVPPSASRKNVASEMADPLSLLNFYKRALALRRRSPALLDGTYESVGNDPHIFAYLRRTPRQTMLIALNMSLEARQLKLDQSTLGGAGAGLRMVLSNWRYGPQEVDARPLHLAPLEAAVMEVITK